MAEKLGEDVLDEIRRVAPDITDGIERLHTHRRNLVPGDDRPEDEIPADFSFLLDFEHNGQKLTPRQLQFVVSYVINGFTRATAGDNEALTHPVVLAALRAVTADCTRRFQVTPDRVVRELIPLISSNITDVMDISAAGITLKDFATLPREFTAAVQEVHEIRNAQGTQLRVKLYDKIAALNTLSKLLGFNKEQSQDISLTIDVGDRLSNALQRLKKSQHPDAIEGELALPALEAPRGA